MIYSISITAILFIFSLIMKRSKCLYFLDFIWMWVQLAYCTDYNRVDYQNYVTKFVSISVNGVEIKNSEFLYLYLNKFFSYFTDNFAVVMAILAFISLFLIAYIIPKYTKNIAIISALYMLYPLYNNGIQIRWFLASSIIIYAFQYLINDKKQPIRFTILCLVAMTIHTLSIFLLAFIIIINFSDKKLIIITILISCFIFTILNIVSDFAVFLIGEQRYESKISHSNGIIEMLFAGLWQIGMLLLMSFIKNLVSSETEFDKIIYKSTILTSFIIPLYLMDFSFERIVRLLFIFQIIYIVNGINKILGKERIIASTLFSLYFIFTFIYFELIYSNGFNIKFKTYMANNDIINNPQNHIMIIFVILLVGIFMFAMDMNNITICLSNKRIKGDC